MTRMMTLPLKPMSVLLLGLAALVAPALTGCHFDAPGQPFSTAGDQSLGDGPTLRDATVDPHLNDFPLRVDRLARNDDAADDYTPRPDRLNGDLRRPDRSMPDLPRTDVTSSLPCDDLFEDHVDNYDPCIETPSTCTFYRSSDQTKRTCNEVCSSAGKLCLGAYEDDADQCAFITELGCDFQSWDNICMCLR